MVDASGILGSPTAMVVTVISTTSLTLSSPPSSPSLLTAVMASLWRKGGRWRMDKGGRGGGGGGGGGGVKTGKREQIQLLTYKQCPVRDR